MKKLIEYYEKKALSNFDILKLLDNKANIVLYPNLFKYRNLDEILEPYGCCILLFEARPRYGHWCAIFKLDDETVEFFNPYGGYPDDSLDNIPKTFRMKTHQYYPYLSQLMYDSPYKLTYNEFEFQKKGIDTKTCGRHCVVRLLCKDLTLYEYVKLMDELCKRLKTDYDGVVTVLTS